MSNIWNVGRTLEEAEREIIIQALKFFAYNKTMTANSLGVSLRGLDGKIKRFNIEMPNARQKTSAS